MVRIETVNPVFAMWGKLVLRTGVPQMHVSINNKDVMPVVRVHGAPPSSLSFLYRTDVTQLPLEALGLP